MNRATHPDHTVLTTYDELGNVVSVTDQLLSADYTSQTDQDYAYDDNGNRDDSMGYTTGPNNQLLDDGTFSYTYDDEGNRISRTHNTTGATTRYAWDFRNRLIEVTEHADANPATPASHRVEYTYDYLDRRIEKALDLDGDGLNSPTYTYQVHRGDEVALEFTDPDGLADDTTNPTLAHRYLYGAAVDQILAVEDDAGDVLWGLADHQGTIRDVIDSSGNLDTHIEYDSFGRITVGTAASADFLFAYAGRPIDPETGMYNYRARWYDPEVGRFVSEDPISFAAGDANLYRYVGNSPVVYVDPSGLCYDGFSDSGSYGPFSVRDILRWLIGMRGLGSTPQELPGELADEPTQPADEVEESNSSRPETVRVPNPVTAQPRSDIVVTGPIIPYSAILGPPTFEDLRWRLVFDPYHHGEAVNGGVDEDRLFRLPLEGPGSPVSPAPPSFRDQWEWGEAIGGPDPNRDITWWFDERFPGHVGEAKRKAREIVDARIRESGRPIRSIPSLKTPVHRVRADHDYTDTWGELLYRRPDDFGETAFGDRRQTGWEANAVGPGNFSFRFDNVHIRWHSEHEYTWSGRLTAWDSLGVSTGDPTEGSWMARGLGARKDYDVQRGEWFIEGQGDLRRK